MLLLTAKGLLKAHHTGGYCATDNIQTEQAADETAGSNEAGTESDIAEDLSGENSFSDDMNENVENEDSLSGDETASPSGGTDGEAEAEIPDESESDLMNQSGDSLSETGLSDQADSAENPEEKIAEKKSVPVRGSVEYSAHVQNLGWIGPVKDGAVGGTQGKNYRWRR